MLMSIYSESQVKKTTFYLSDPIDDLEKYFSGDLVTSANQLMADKVELAMDVLSYSSEDATSITVNSNGTQLIGEYTANSSASWKGGAKIIVNGTGLSTDSSDANYIISDISVLLTSSDTPTDWSNPLFEIDMGLGLTVVDDRATTLNYNSSSVQAGDMKVSWTGSIAWDSTSNTAVDTGSRFEVVYDSDPSDAVVLSTFYLEGEFTANGDTEVFSGKVSKIGVTNEAGHYFYSDDLDITINSSAGSEAVYSGTGIDTLHTYATAELPSEWENVVMEGGNNISITANSLDNQIDTNNGSNAVTTLSGNDTINLKADSVWGGDYVAKNMSNSLSIGTNEKISINGLNSFSDVIDGGADIDTLNLTTGNDAFFIDDVYSDTHNSLALASTTQGIDSIARVASLEVINAGDGNDIVDLTSNNFVLAEAVVINGEAGNDNLWGSNGNDVIDGGIGDDSIFGGTGSDTLTGGTGSDIFQFTATAGSDVITDFNLTDDSIQLYYRATDKHTNADLDLTNGVLTWDVDNTNTNIVIDLSTTVDSSNLSEFDVLISFVEIV
jgi:Ca2+-binding RTX toxin-like protein